MGGGYFSIFVLYVSSLVLLFLMFSDEQTCEKTQDHIFLCVVAFRFHVFSCSFECSCLVQMCFFTTIVLVSPSFISFSLFVVLKGYARL